MTVNGFDFAAGQPSAKGLLSAGAAFVCRYLSSTWKGIRHDEYERYATGGVRVVLNYEDSGRESLGGFAAGVRYARIAETNRHNAGIPEAPIYFSVDFEPDATQMPVVMAYLDGVASVIGRDRTGVYGSYDVVEAAHAGGHASWFWQTYAWSSGRRSAHAHLWQYQNGVQRAGITVDLDEALQPDYGAVGSPGLASIGPAQTITSQEDDMTPDQDTRLKAIEEALFGPTSAGAKTPLSWTNLDGSHQTASYGVLPIVIYTQQLVGKYAAQQAAQIAALSNVVSQIKGGGAVDMAAVTTAAQAGAQEALKGLTLTATVPAS